MKKKKIIIIVAIVIIAILLGVMIVFKPKKLNRSSNSQNEIIENMLNINYDENTSIYEIYDDNGQLITTAQDEEEAKWYKENPYFRPAPSSNIDEEILPDNSN